jgi:protein-S-isoprenylcysteine O-methyltransferase Ste14
MSSYEPENSEQRRLKVRDLLMETGLRVLAVFAFILLVVSLLNAYLADTSRVSLLVLLVIETFTLALIVFAREARTRDISWLSMGATICASFYFVLLDVAPTRHLAPEWVAVAFQGAGMAWQVWAKATLGRSFGLLPAHRAVVTSGPYGVVRHPIYLGYLISHIGFLLANFSGRNAAVIAGLYALQMVRMVLEERLLARDSAEYQGYQRSVRWQFIPGVL